VHRDIKLKNILLQKTNNNNNNNNKEINNKYNVKMSDFGISKKLMNKKENSNKNTTLAYTVRYAAKEVIEDGITNFKSDIWSLGLVLYEIFVAERPWGNE
jgi:serine/threonine protein kinase